VVRALRAGSPRARAPLRAACENPGNSAQSTGPADRPVGWARTGTGGGIPFFRGLIDCFP